MAKPPEVKRISREDMPEAPAWLERLLRPLNLFMGPAHAALARGLTFADNMAAEVKTLDVTAPEEWQSPVFAGAWTHFGGGWEGVAYRKTDSGEVVLAGLATGGAAPSTVLTLPVGFRPAHPMHFACNGADAFASVQVSTLGEVSLAAGAAPLDLRGVRFEAADRTPPAWPAPVRFALREGLARPTLLWVAAAREKGSGLPVGNVSADWAPDTLEGARAGVKVRRFNGLAPGLKYTVTLVICSA